MAVGSHLACLWRQYRPQSRSPLAWRTGTRSETNHTTRSSTTSRSLTYIIALGDVARNAALHDSVTLSCLLKAFCLQSELKTLAIF